MMLLLFLDDLLQGMNSARVSNFQSRDLLMQVTQHHPLNCDCRRCHRTSTK